MFDCIEAEPKIEGSPKGVHGSRLGLGIKKEHKIIHHCALVVHIHVFGGRVR